jgi:hypothetical protein
LTKKKRGLLPPKIAESDPWVMVCVDLVGPFTVKTPIKTNPLLALTMIDPVTAWFEIVEDTHKLAASIQDLFHVVFEAQLWSIQTCNNSRHTTQNKTYNGLVSSFSGMCVDYTLISLKKVASDKYRNHSP